MPVAIRSRLPRVVRLSPKLHRFLGRVRWDAVHCGAQIGRWLLPARLDFGPSRGWFSAAQEVRKGVRQGRIVLEQQRAPEKSRTSLRRVAGLGQETQKPWPIFWSYHSNSRLVGSTLLLQNERRQSVVEAGYGPDFIKHDPGYWHFRFPPAVRLEGNWTSVVSRFSNGFPHWFLDSLPRLALLSELPADTRVIVPANLEGYHRATLDWLGLSDRIRRTPEEHLCMDHFYFSSMTNITGLFDPYAVEFCRRSFLHRRDTTFDSPRRFFVHRVNVRRGLINEREVLNFFRERGWAVVDTQALTMAQQIQLFACAKHVCALHGAALTNLLWSEPACRVLELVPSTFLNGVFEGLAEARGLRHYSFLLCKGDADYNAFVDLNELARCLDQHEHE